MNKNCINIILILWCGLLWASPTNFSIESDLEFSNELVLVSKDTLNPKEKDSTETKKIDKAHLAPPASASVTLVPS